MALATLSIDIVAQLANLQAGMDKAGRIAEKQASEIEARFSRVTAAVGAVGGALGVGALISQITLLARATIDGVDALNDIADATGATIENISALEDIAARTGTRMDTVSSALVRFNRVLSDATPDSPMARALASIGVNAAELRKIDPAEALRQTAVALSGFADDGDKARMVQDLFGKSVAEVAPLLKDLAESGRLNATVTAEQAKAAEEFNKQLARMNKEAVDASRAVMGPLVTAINEFVARAKTASDESKTLGERLQAVYGAAKSLGFGALLGLNNKEVDLLKQAQVELAAIEKALQRQDISAQRRAELEEKRIGRQQTINKLQAQEMAAFRPSQNYGEGYRPSVPAAPAAPAAVERQRPFISNSFNQDTINALRQLQGTDTNKVRELESALRGLFELQRETRGDPAVAQAIAKVRAELEAFTTKKMPDAEPLRAYQDALAAIANTNAAQITALSASLDELFKLRDTQLFGPEVDQAIANLRDRLAELKKPLQETNEFAVQAGRNIQDALGQSILESMSGSARDIGRIWTDLLKRMLAEAAAAQLGKALLGDQFAKGGELGGVAGEALAWFKANWGGARANGGPVRAGRPYLVGERGPEIMVPNSNGTVLPNGTGMGGGGGSTFTVQVMGDASENTLRLINGALAQFEARQLSRRGV